MQESRIFFWPFHKNEMGHYNPVFTHRGPSKSGVKRRKMDPSSDLKIWYQIDRFNTFITSPSKALVAVNLGIAQMCHDNFGINILLMT